MALKLTVKPGEKIFIGTAEISVQCDTIVNVIVGGHAPILRSEDFVSEDDATTPARRLQYVVQQMYLTGDLAGHHIPYFEAAQALLREAPEHGAAIAEVNALLAKGAAYKAIKRLKFLFDPALDDSAPLKLVG